MAPATLFVIDDDQNLRATLAMALALAGGNPTRAGALLGITRGRMRHQAEKLGLK